MKPVAIYARVSSERQKEQETIASQTAALLEYAASQNWMVPEEWRFLDEGYSGASLVRPGLDRLRDQSRKGRSTAWWRCPPTGSVGNTPIRSY